MMGAPARTRPLTSDRRADLLLEIQGDPAAAKARPAELRVAEDAAKAAEAAAANAKALAEAARDESAASSKLAEQRRALEADERAFAERKARVDAEFAASEQELAVANERLAIAVASNERRAADLDAALAHVRVLFDLPKANG